LGNSVGLLDVFSPNGVPHAHVGAHLQHGLRLALAQIATHNKDEPFSAASSV